MEFRDALKHLRSELGLTQTDLASALHVNYATISRWELGKTYPNRSLSTALLEYAHTHAASQACCSELKRTIVDATKRKLDWSGRRIRCIADVPEAVAGRLLSLDYESILAIDVETGAAHPYTGSHIKDVISEQKSAGDNVAGVEAYLRKYCADDDVERVIRETGLPYVKKQLEARTVFPVAYSLRQNGEIIHKRVIYTYLDETRTTILCAMQNITELYDLESTKRDQVAAALQTLQELGGMNVARYDLKTKTFYSNSDMVARMGYANAIPNVPEEFIQRGLIAPAFIDEYRAFFAKLCAGEDSSLTTACKAADGSFHWMRLDARIIRDSDAKPRQAILSFKDIEEQREQAAVYKKWRQSLEERKPENYTLFRCNLSKGASFDKIEGALLRSEQFDPNVKTFNERTREYAGRFVHLDDFEAYTALLNSENLLAGYYRGTRRASLAYRERVGADTYRRLHVSVEVAQYPDSPDVEVFLLYEPASEAQMEDPAIKARMDADSLTGILNRRAFKEQFDALLAAAQPRAKHALLLVDIDGFKRINENFGHAVGDQALVDIASALRAVVREDALLGRLGGDEFLICLKNVSGQAVVEQKAAQILARLRKVFSVDIRVTASLGGAFYPDDGRDFDALYHNVDRALYMAKANGRDSFAFYRGELMRPQGAQANRGVAKEQLRRRHILLVDDSPETLALLEEMFAEQYRVEACADEAGVIARLRRYGISLSVVLLRLDLPSADPFALLDRIRQSGEISAVPVITLCESGARDLCVRSLQHGANDFILAPFDPTLLQIRIDSAISKTENDRLRAQNAYLQTQSSGASQFRAVYENTGTVVVEYDWETHAFVYDPAISEHIFGRYDDRSLWQILMADMVADVRDVKAIQALILDLSNSRSRMNGSIDVMLKTPAKVRHWFTISAFKRVNDINLPSKIILTFVDVNEDILASKKLRFQAEHDNLTELYNRESFSKLVEETVRLRPAGSYVLLCCDINDFRFLNERFGREEGDKLLRYAAEKLLTYANAMDGFAGRLSNDVYAILLPHTPGVLDRAAVLIQGFFAGYPLNAKLTGRAGAYVISDPEMTAGGMLDLASTACNTIKGKFGACLAVYDESMNEKRLREKSISDRMEAALLNDQFEVYIQPQFHHATGQIVGAEVLARWIDPERGVIPPAEFIPVFEKNGFITRMDEYVWEKAARYLSAWITKGNEPVPLSVNVSREDTKDPELCKKLLAIIEKYNIPIHLFRLEITESLFAKDTERLVAVVEELHSAGFLIEMDDFGSGYSSLNILKDVPVDVLKLDMKFFSGADNLGRGGMIINAVLRMSRWLNIPVIAEGVELKDQADFLLSVGCPTIQGYLYEQPMPAGDFEKMLLAGGAKGVVLQNTVDTRLEACSFWDPLSADSQIFNNYIGPAAILEYHEGKYEIVRMNKRFIDALEIDEAAMLPRCDPVRLCEEDKPKFRKAVLEMIYSGKDAALDVRCTLRDGSMPVFHATLRLIARSAERTLVFAALDA